MQTYLDASRERVWKSLRDLSPNPKTIRGDLLAGFTFAAVNIPQGLAYALMAGITPVNGLYTLMLATPVAALFTGSIFMNVSSTGAVSASLADTLQFFPSDSRLVALGLLVVLMGIFQFLLGLFRMGWIMRFVPNSVMVGFMTGVALNIILGQLDELTAYTSTEANKVLQLADTVVNRRLIENESLAIGLLTILLILLLERTRIKGIAMLASMAITSGIALIFNLTNVAFVRDVAEITSSLPKAVALNWSYFPAVIVPAMAVGMLGLVQGAAVGQSFPNPNGKYGNVNRDFMGTGLGNIVTGFFRGLPAGGSASGTGVVVGAGAHSRWANIFAGAFVLVIVLLFGSLAELVAMPALAGLLILIGARMINFRAISSVWNTSVLASTSLGLTLAASLLIPLQYAVLVGIAVSVLINLFQQSEQVRLVELVWSDTQFPIEQPAPKDLPSDTITTLHIHGSLFFAAAANMEATLPDAAAARNAVVLLGIRGHQEVGSTLIAVLDRYVRQLQANGNRLIVVGAGKNIMRQLDKTGITALVGKESIYGEDKQIGYALALGYADAVRWLQARGVDVHRPQSLRLPE
jgi:SulP family sulfate permease